METFNVLIVDDEAGVTSELVKRLNNCPEIAVVTAHSAAEARAVLYEHFFHLAFVDMHLGDNVPDGMGVLKSIADDHPSCRCLLLTQFPKEYREELSTLLHPVRPQIQGIIDKVVGNPRAATVTQELSRRWLNNKITVDGVTAIFDSLKKKVAKSTFAQVTVAEVDYVISALLGQGWDLGDGDDLYDMSRIRLEFLPGGRSRSVVTAGRPESSRGILGVWCVVKVGPRSETIEEYNRYCRYVRFVMARSHRVELLNVVHGDTIGAVCYSFAGKAPEQVTTLNQVIRTESENIFSCLENMFGVEARELYDRTGPDEDIAKYFARSYQFGPISVLDNLRQAAEELARRLEGIRLDNGDLQTMDERLLSAKKALGNPFLQTLLPTCIVHGDMNAGNVIVGDENRVIFIDYRHSGCGLRAVDFAAVEGSLRLLHAEVLTSRDISTAARVALNSNKGESRVWRLSWSADKSKDEEAIGKLDYWERVSCAVVAHARVNFPDLQAKEYAGTCLYWALRLFRWQGMSLVAKARLLSWISTLSKIVIA